MVVANIVEVAIPVDENAARVLADPKEREAAGRMVSDALRERGRDEFLQAMRALQESAREAGLTDADVDAELEAYNAERRGVR